MFVLMGRCLMWHVQAISIFNFVFFVHFFAIGWSKTLDEKKMELKQKQEIES
jgi:hypothetical protein